MGTTLIDNFDYRGRRFLDARQSVASLAALRAMEESSVPEGFRAYCAETSLWYEFNPANPSDPSTGRWRAIPTELAQQTGDRSDIPMSQKAVKEAISDFSCLNYIRTVDGVIDSNLSEIEDSTIKCEGETEEGYLLGRNGKPTPFADYSVSPYLTMGDSITPPVIFVRDYLSLSPSFAQVAFYTKDKEFITSLTSLAPNTCIILQPDFYIRITWRGSKTKPLSLSLASVINNPSETDAITKSLNDVFGEQILVSDGFLDDSSAIDFDKELLDITPDTLFSGNRDITFNGYNRVVLSPGDDEKRLYTYYQVNFNNVNKGFYNLVLFDKATDKVIRGFSLVGTHLFQVKENDTFRVVVYIQQRDITTILRGYTPNFIASKIPEIENKIGQLLPEAASKPKILWLGTSIPEGCAYPKNACANLGREVLNKSLGASFITSKDVPEAYHYAMGKSLTETVDEKRQKYKTGQFAEVTDEKFESAEFKGASYEERLLPYLSEVDTVVFDHGYNDRAVIANDLKSEIDWDSRDRSTYVGAFNFLLDLIYSVRTDMRIIIATHFSNSDIDWNIPPCVEMQTKIAEHYGFPLIEVWKDFPATKYHIPDSAAYITEFNAEYGTNYNTNWNLDANGNITSYQFLCPDTVHPHTDKTGNSLRLLTGIFTKGLRDLI